MLSRQVPVNRILHSVSLIRAETAENRVKMTFKFFEDPEDYYNFNMKLYEVYVTYSSDSYEFLVYYYSAMMELDMAKFAARGYDLTAQRVSDYLSVGST